VAVLTGRRPPSTLASTAHGHRTREVMSKRRTVLDVQGVTAGRETTSPECGMKRRIMKEGSTQGASLSPTMIRVGHAEGLQPGFHVEGRRLRLRSRRRRTNCSSALASARWRLDFACALLSNPLHSGGAYPPTA
jgi:hypothetical protein